MTIKDMNMINTMRWLATGLLARGVAAASQAQPTQFPNRPIRIVVPFAAGGATDVIARLVGKRVSDLLGPPVVIDNKARANGNTAAMKGVMHLVSDAEIKAIAEYVASMK